MDIKKQVCSVEQAIKLRQLGILQDNSQFMYVKQQETDQWELVWVGASYEWTEHPNYSRFTFSVNTFTVAELGVMLSNWLSKIVNNFEEDSWTGYYREEEVVIYGGGTEAEAKAVFLIWLLENKLIDVESVNERLAS